MTLVRSWAIALNTDHSTSPLPGWKRFQYDLVKNDSAVSHSGNQRISTYQFFRASGHCRKSAGNQSRSDRREYCSTRGDPALDTDLLSQNHLSSAQPGPASHTAHDCRHAARCCHWVIGQKICRAFTGKPSARGLHVTRHGFIPAADSAYPAKGSKLHANHLQAGSLRGSRAGDRHSAGHFAQRQHHRGGAIRRHV